MPDYNTLVRKYNAQLTEQRLLMNQWVATVSEQYLLLPDEIRLQLPVLNGHTGAELVPALYTDEITPEVEEAYKQQIAALEAFVEACNKKLTELNQQEEIRCMLQ